jgi:hypothetical protein
VAVVTATPPFAAPSDVEAIWRPLSDAETVQAAGLLGEASQVVLEIPQVAARVSAGLVSDATLRSVVVRMVLRVLLNPQRLSQFSNTVDDVSRSGTFESGLVPAGELVVSPGEFDRLMGRVGLAGAFSVLQPALLVVPDVDFGFPPGADLNKLYLLDPTD